jgi:hypothetical protein
MGVDDFVLLLQIEGVFGIFRILKAMFAILLVKIFAVVCDDVRGIGVLYKPVYDSLMPSLKLD